MNEADVIQAVDRLHLEPGDLVILRCVKPISRDQAEQLLELAKHHIPDHEVLVLAEGISLEVERPEDEGLEPIATEPFYGKDKR